MSKVKLKKALSSLSKEEIIETLLELYDARKEAKEYLEYWLNPDADKELEKAKKSIDRQFFLSAGETPRKRPQLTASSKTLKDFMTLCFEPEKVADLLLHFAERECDWLEQRFRRLSYRGSLKKNIDTASLYIETHELESLYNLRLERLLQRQESLFAYQQHSGFTFFRPRR